MNLERSALFQQLASKLPDLPRWVEARALLLWNACEVFGLHETPELSFVLRSQTSKLAIVVGSPEAGWSWLA